MILLMIMPLAGFVLVVLAALGYNVGWTASYFGIAIALFWLWYPQYEDDRMKRRREDRELKQKEFEFCLKYRLERYPTREEQDEWFYWYLHGRGKPYKDATSSEGDSTSCRSTRESIRQGWQALHPASLASYARRASRRARRNGPDSSSPP